MFVCSQLLRMCSVGVGVRRSKNGGLQGYSLCTRFWGLVDKKVDGNVTYGRFEDYGHDSESLTWLVPRRLWAMIHVQAALHIGRRKKGLWD